MISNLQASTLEKTCCKKDRKLQIKEFQSNVLNKQFQEAVESDIIYERLFSKVTFSFSSMQPAVNRAKETAVSYCMGNAACLRASV